MLLLPHRSAWLSPTTACEQHTVLKEASMGQSWPPGGDRTVPITFQPCPS